METPRLKMEKIEENKNIYIYIYIYSKIPILRPPLGLSRGGLIGRVVLLADIKYKERLIWDLKMRFLIAE